MSFQRLEKIYHKFRLKDIVTSMEKTPGTGDFSKDFIYQTFNGMQFVSVDNRVVRPTLLSMQMPGNVTYDVTRAVNFLDNYYYERVYFETESDLPLFRTVLGKERINVFGLVFFRVQRGRYFIQLLTESKCIGVIFDAESFQGDRFILSSVYEYLSILTSGMVNFFYTKKSDKMVTMNDTGLLDSCYDLIPVPGVPVVPQDYH